MVMHSPEDDRCLSRGMRRDRSTVYLSTTMGPSTNTAKPGQGRWLRLGWAAIKTAKGGKGGILLNDRLVFMCAIIVLLNLTVIKIRNQKVKCVIVSLLKLFPFSSLMCRDNAAVCFNVTVKFWLKRCLVWKCLYFVLY